MTSTFLGFPTKLNILVRLIVGVGGLDIELTMKVGKRGLIISHLQKKLSFTAGPEKLTSNDHDCCGKSPFHPGGTSVKLMARGGVFLVGWACNT